MKEKDNEDSKPDEEVVPKINLSNTPLNDGYRKEGLFDLPNNLKRRLRALYRFSNNPTDEQMWKRINGVVKILQDYNSNHETCNDVVLGATSLLIRPLETVLIREGYRVHYFCAEKKWGEGKSKAEYIHYGTRPAMVME